MAYVPPPKTWTAKERAWLILAMFVAVTTIVISLRSSLERDPYTIPVIVSIMLLAATGFILRQKQRMVYALVELLLGLLLTMYAVIGEARNLGDALNVDLPSIALHLKWASFLSGVYFTIRALDNMGKALKANQRRATIFNADIDRDWQQLVALEAERLWVNRGRLTTTQSQDWAEAEIIVHGKKKFSPEADLWERLFGFD